MRKFKTQEVQDLYEVVQEYGHPDFPFLDPNYSIGGYYPVTDFTPTIGNWLLNGRGSAIEELWQYITDGSIFAKAILRKADGAVCPTFFGFDQQTTAEIKAVHLLGNRMGLYDNPNSVEFQIGRVLATRIASLNWRPPSELIPHLLKGIEAEAYEIFGDNSRDARLERAVNAVAELCLPRDECDKNFGEWMLSIPPMVRLVIGDYLERSNGFLRPHLYYGDRKYGCCAELNRTWVGWIGFFKTPSDNATIPHGLTAKILKAELANHGSIVNCSAKKNDLIQQTKSKPGLLRKIYAEHLPDYVTLEAHWEPPLKKWVKRCKILRPFCLAILKTLAFQSLRTKLA